MTRAVCRVCHRTAEFGQPVLHAVTCEFYVLGDCREADGSGPCRFVGVCPENRRRTMVQLGARGEDCWAFGSLSAKGAA